MNENLEVAFNDIDFCLKIRATGKLIVYNPYVQLKHYESKTRGYENSPEKIKRFEKEQEIFISRWKSVIEAGDPYYNKNLRLDSDQYNIKNCKV